MESQCGFISHPLERDQSGSSSCSKPGILRDELGGHVLINSFFMNLIRFYLLLFFLINKCNMIIARAQKPPLDTALFGKWPEIQQPMISNDGRYSTYIIKNETPGNDYLHIISNYTNWEFKVVAGHSPFFCCSSEFLFFLKPHDSLGILDLKKHKIEYLCDIKSFETPETGASGWLAYLSDSQVNKLVVRSLKTGEDHVFDDVTSYRFSKDGKILLVQEVDRG